jgi:hypothetical protein
MRRPPRKVPLSQEYRKRTAKCRKRAQKSMFWAQESMTTGRKQGILRE